MEERNLTCIGCPLGCQIKVTLENGQVRSVEGNTCKRGDDYARKEVTNPTRIYTSTVYIEGGTEHMLPVKTASDIPKADMIKCSKELKGHTVKAPVKAGDVIFKNIAGSGVDIIATKSIAAL